MAGHVQGQLWTCVGTCLEKCVETRVETRVQRRAKEKCVEACLRTGTGLIDGVIHTGFLRGGPEKKSGPAPCVAVSALTYDATLSQLYLAIADGGHFEHRHADTRAMDMPSAMPRPIKKIGTCGVCRSIRLDV